MISEGQFQHCHDAGHEDDLSSEDNTERRLNIAVDTIPQEDDGVSQVNSTHVDINTEIENHMAEGECSGEGEMDSQDGNSEASYVL